ncbi:hypothetical protein CK216_22970 [Mesorhizobium sp. WSM3876]|nr:hypothetical protein CK216_22970 [Mesorhizobium sp. WSM3876]
MTFEAIRIDERGGPLRLVVPDPRVFAAYKFWVSKRVDREPVRRRRDLAQAEPVAELTTHYLSISRMNQVSFRVLPGRFSRTRVVCSCDRFERAATPGSGSMQLH